LLRFWGVFTVDASSTENAQQSFISIAKACGTDPNERAAKSWLSSSDRPWLLLIDNANDTNLEIEKYFPDGEHGLTLITTRNPSVKMHGTIGRRYYHFDRLNDDEANELLLRAADHEPRTPTIMRLALTITRKLGALPLALIHAGNAIRANYCKLSNYLEYYDRNWQMIRHSQGTTGEDEDDSEYMKVYASYEIVFRGLEAIKSQRYRDAVQLLKLISFFHHEHTPFEVLIAAVKHPRLQQEVDAQATKHIDNSWTTFFKLSWRPSLWTKHLQSIGEWLFVKKLLLRYPVVVPTFLRDADLFTTSEDCSVRLRGALHLLTQLSLITHYESSDSYSMHPLVHTWVRERPQMKTQDQAVWCEAALQTLSRCILLPPLNEVVDPNGDLARRMLPHIVSVRNFQQRIEQEFVRNRTMQKGIYSTIYSDTTPWRAMFLAKCAIVYSECGYFVEAEASLRIVVEFNTRLLGVDHPRTERAILAVSDSLWQQCRVNEAADLQEQVLQRNIKALGLDHPRTLNLMFRVGENRRQQGRFAESIELLTNAMYGMKTQLPSTDPEVYHVQERLGITLRVCFRFEDARKHLEQAVDGMKSCVGEKDPRTLVTLEELAITYRELGNILMGSNESLARMYLDMALQQASFVVEQRKKQLGDRQPFTWMAQGTLGRIKAAMGQVDEADEIFSTVLPVAARHFGDDHLVIMCHKTYHAKIMMQQERYREAETLLLDVSQPSKYKTATFTGDHPDRWDALWTLVQCFQKQGKIEASLAKCNVLLEAVRAIQEGKDQTEVSSTFWRMVLDKRAELAAINDANAGQHSTHSTPERLLKSDALLHSTVPALSSGTHIVATHNIRNLRSRGTMNTW
jgi:Tetratricopeptide repeat